MCSVTTAIYIVPSNLTITLPDYGIIAVSRNLVVVLEK